VVRDEVLAGVETLEGNPPGGDHFVAGEGGWFAARQGGVVDRDRVGVQRAEALPVAGIGEHAHSRGDLGDLLVAVGVAAVRAAC